tara:strand:+ start:9973 stop:10908 length:936 start_codon:yes stop_codon:yes gene_type:complete
MITHRPPKDYPVDGHENLFSCYDWHPGKADNVLLRMSKSSVMSDYGFCQQQYFIKRGIGMKEPQNDNMLRGTNVHDSLEMFYQRVDIKKAQQVDDIYAYFKECFGKPHEIRSQQELFTLDEDTHIDRLIVAEVERFNACDPDHFLPTGNELLVDTVHTIDVDGTPQRIHFTGFIDRVFTNPDGSLHIHELKTGTWLKRGKVSKKKEEAMRKEMAFYVWLLNKTDTTLKITHWGWDHTGGDGLFRHVEPVRVQEIQSMIAQIQSCVRSHRNYKGDGNGDSFQLLPPGAQFNLCDPWCSLKEFCPRYSMEDLP